MAFTLDRMLTRANPMRARLASGRYFVRYVAIEDESQRRSIATALNQWIANSGEKASGIGAHFATSLEFNIGNAHVTGSSNAHVATDAFVRPASEASSPSTSVATDASSVPRSEASGIGTKPASPPPISPTAPHLNSGAATNIHCPSPLPSGF
jgi:hypothetical protein